MVSSFTKTFFRRDQVRTGPLWLERNPLANPIFTTMKKSTLNALLATWLTLPDAQRNEMKLASGHLALCLEKSALVTLDKTRWKLPPPRESQPIAKNAWPCPTTSSGR